MRGGSPSRPGRHWRGPSSCAPRATPSRRSCAPHEHHWFDLKLVVCYRDRDEAIPRLSEQIPPEVQELLRDCVPSFEALEVLLRLRAEGGPTATESIHKRLKLPESVIDEALEMLCQRGLVASREHEGTVLYAYDPRPSDREKSVEWLARAWSEGGVMIAKALTANAIDRVRNSASRTFSDAFLLWRKDKDRG